MHPKTPDVKLDVPISVNGHIINWIDSKATFGDDYVLHDNKDQFMGYVNRFGPGMVIFWFDFVETLEAPDGVLFVRDFPSEFNVIPL